MISTLLESSLKVKMGTQAGRRRRDGKNKNRGLVLPDKGLTLLLCFHPIFCTIEPCGGGRGGSQACGPDRSLVTMGPLRVKEERFRGCDVSAPDT